MLVCTSMYWYILVHTSIYCFILTGDCVYWYIQVYTVTGKYKSVHTSTYLYIPACTWSYWYILVHTSTHQYIPVLRWLPIKLAEWIGENLQEALGFPDKGYVRARLWVDRSWVESYFAGACCGWYLDNLWLCRVGVWAVLGRNACQMLACTI